MDVEDDVGTSLDFGARPGDSRTKGVSNTTEGGAAMDQRTDASVGKTATCLGYFERLLCDLPFICSLGGKNRRRQSSDPPSGGIQGIKPTGPREFVPLSRQALEARATTSDVGCVIRDTEASV